VTLTEGGKVRERHAWVAVTAVLGTSLLWLASVNLVLLLNACAGCSPEAAVIVRALARTALHVGQAGGPTALAALGLAVVLLAIGLRPVYQSGRSSRHG
jgi:hypothetical protein